MSDNLTPEEADDVAKNILPIMEPWIEQSIFERGFLRISDIGKIIPSVKRAGSKPDTYCKIAVATLEHGVVTDLRKDRMSNMVLSFRKAKPKDTPPSPEICSAKWEIINSLPFEKVRSFNYEENDVDNLNQKDAERILRELNQTQ